MARPVPPFDLGQCKAQVRRRSYDAIKNLVAYIEHLDIREQLDIWEIFSEILAESPPSIEVLKKCFLPSEAPVLRCRVVLILIQGTSLTLIRYEANMLQEMLLIEKLKVIWPDIWKWMDSIFFYHRHSPLPRPTLLLISDNDIPTATFHLVSTCHFCAVYLSRAGRGHVSVMFTPSFVKLYTSWWYEAAGNRRITRPIYHSICLIIRLLVQFEDTPTTSKMVHSLSSSTNFAACLLAHICVGAGENTSLKKILGYSVAVLPCSLTEEIHHELHAQNSVQTVISILGRVMGSRDDELIANIILYLNQSMRTAGQSQARVISKSHILLFLAAIASPNRQGEEPPKSLYSAIADFFEIFGQFCLYRSNVKALVQRTDQLNRDHENWQGHFKTPQVEGAWLLFQQCFAEGRRAKERRDSPLKMCTSCGTKAFRKDFSQCGHCTALYCNATCQGLDWRSGNHRRVCARHDYMMLYKDFDTIVHRARTLIARFLPRLALFYDKFVVYAQRNDLPPLLCIVDMTRFPQRITLHPDLSDAAYAQVGDVMPLRLAKSHPCLLVFAALPPADRSKLLFVHGTLQPSPSYTSYQGFLASSLDPEASQAQLQPDLASESLFPDVSFLWATGGDWDSDNVTI